MLRHRASLRLRLTLSYGLLFFVVGFLLIALSYVLLRQVAIRDPGELAAHTSEQLQLSQAYLQQHMPSPGGGRQTVGAFLLGLQDQVLSEVLQALLRTTFVALAVATIVSVVAGWWMAGRTLRPVQEISAVARRLSASTLHERIDLKGPKDELRQLADTFDAMLGRLESAFVAQREFVSNASHELRTPLAIMRTELDVTLADPATDAEDLRRMAETIRGAIARSEDVIDKLLVLAESGDLVEHDAVDMAGVVEAIVQRHDRAAEARRLSFQVDAQSAIVSGDGALLERLVDNLVDNAVRYASPGSAIRVSTGVGPDGQAMLCVANEGEVIGPEEVPRLFERFYRIDKARSRESGGTGLGLAIAKHIVLAHGGTIRAESELSRGSNFLFTLPLTAEHSAAPPFVSDADVLPGKIDA
jgi:signal transduction histidine kinase